MRAKYCYFLSLLCHFFPLHFNLFSFSSSLDHVAIFVCSMYRKDSAHFSLRPMNKNHWLDYSLVVWQNETIPCGKRLTNSASRTQTVNFNLKSGHRSICTVVGSINLLFKLTNNETEYAAMIWLIWIFCHEKNTHIKSIHWKNILVKITLRANTQLRYLCGQSTKGRPMT